MRAARLEDVPHILALLRDDDLGKLREDGTLEEYEKAFAAVAGDGNQFLAVAADSGEIIGCLQITFIPGLARRGLWRGQIEGVRIARHRRGQGFGKALMEWAIATYKARGCGLVQLISDKTRDDAHRFYESLGFKASHMGFKLYV